MAEKITWFNLIIKFKEELESRKEDSDCLLQAPDVQARIANLTWFNLPKKLEDLAEEMNNYIPIEQKITLSNNIWQNIQGTLDEILSLVDSVDCGSEGDTPILGGPGDGIGIGEPGDGGAPEGGF